MPDVKLWTYADRTHPVYERPPEDVRFPVPLGGQVAAEYGEEPDRLHPEREPLVTEELRLQTERAPSMEIYQKAGSGHTVQRLRLQTRYMASMDLEPLRALAQEYFRALKSLSQGPYSLKDLRRMGHPYGREGAPAWTSLRNPRAVPSMRNVRLRGRFVPDLSVVNRQSGLFERSWHWSVLPNAGGVSVVFWNEALTRRGAPYPWFLVRGTVRMQAHGPWNYIANQFLERFRIVWRTEAAAAARRQRALEGMFGENTNPAPPGGWGSED